QQTIKDLRDAVAAQQQQIENQNQQLNQLRSQLQQLLDATQQANAAAQRGQSAADQAQSRAAHAQQTATEAQRAAEQAALSTSAANSALAVVSKQENEQDKRLNALGDLLGRFRFSGDMRVRGEGFYQDNTITRNRARLRVRFGLDGKLNEDFIGGIA